ncbi:MAG: LamG domain-containing protein [Kiritimatiellaeota bacterium]|nr:LamG domain-containing protein [Kiritimatiellota bacterium]
MVAKTGSATEVYVHKGKVQTIPRDSAGHEQPALVLTADQSRQFDRGVSAEIKHSKPGFRMLARHTHKEPTVSKPAIGHVTPMFPAVPVVSGTVPASGAKRFANALKFDGHFEKQITTRSLTHNAPHTVAFWTRVPATTPLSAAGAMAAWSSKGTPVHIAWNTDPAAGTLGALRTEYGRAAAVGTSTLRDGRWHHVAVVFVPHGRGHGKLHVKQYVDGHLEGSVTQPLPKHVHEKHKAPAGDIVWLGRRLGSPEHFHGELDEVNISDRALAPQQIKELLTPSERVSSPTSSL